MRKSDARKTLSVKLVREAQPRGQRYQILDSEVPQLALQIDVSGSKIYKVRRSHKGVRTDKTIGDATILSLPEARRVARELLASIEVGRGPVRRNDRGPTLAEVAQLCRKDFRYAALAQSTRVLYEGYLDRIVLPAIGGRPIREITVAQLRDLFDDAFCEIGASAAKGCRDASSKVFAFAVRKDILPFNLVRSTDKLSTTNKRRRQLPISEVKAFWIASGGVRRSVDMRDALRLCLLTATRRTEVAELTWGEIDFAEELWTVPVERTKKKSEPYLIPLSSGAISILRARFDALPEPPRHDQRVFNIRADGLTQAMKKMTSKAPFATACTPHDLRRTIINTAAKDFGTPEDVLKRVINHNPHANEAISHYHHYNYLAEKKQVLERWWKLIVAQIECKPLEAVESINVE